MLFTGDLGFRGVSSSAKPLVKKRSPYQDFILELYNQRLEITKELFRPTTYANTQAFPQTAPIVRTRFVADRNSVGFAREKALTISFVERGFERLGLDRQAMGFFVAFIQG